VGGAGYGSRIIGGAGSREEKDQENRIMRGEEPQEMEYFFFFSK
jgi:hypothetical protein